MDRAEFEGDVDCVTWSQSFQIQEEVLAGQRNDNVDSFYYESGGHEKFCKCGCIGVNRYWRITTDRGGSLWGDSSSAGHNPPGDGVFTLLPLSTPVASRGGDTRPLARVYLIHRPIS